MCVVTSSEAITGSEDLGNEIYYMTIEDRSTGGGSMNLENPRKTLKCIFCDMYALTQIFSRNSSLVETIDFSQSHIKKLNNWSRRVSNFENVHALNLSYNQIDDLRITKKFCRTYNS